jgi:hypothetical protein
MNPSASAGRSCPLHYHYGPEALASPPEPLLCDLQTLYVVGGLYGNELALHEVLRLFEQERGPKRLVFNGDFHWFDIDPAIFARVQAAVMAHVALRGNVETELAQDEPDPDAGCGCAYPDWVEQAVVSRSNRILDRLRAATTAAQRRELAALPMWRVARVGRQRVGLVHGDAQSLAGWGFAQEHLRDPAHRPLVRHWFERAQVDIFASTHTCLPVFQQLRVPARHRAAWVLNNGAAGMPNFAGDPAGLFTRIALTPFEGPERRCAVQADDLHLEAIAIQTPAGQAQQRFVQQWPEGSDAHASYFSRIAAGPVYCEADVIRWED